MAAADAEASVSLGAGDEKAHAPLKQCYARKSEGDALKDHTLAFPWRILQSGLRSLCLTEPQRGG